MKFILSVVVCLMVAACATPGVEKAELEKVAVLANVPVGVKIIGPVEVTHCKRNGYESNSAEASALELLRVKAAEMGANGIAGVTYEKDGVSLMNNCWSSAKAKGTAFRN